MMIFDVLLLMPVTAFLLWLFWYTAPAQRPATQAVIDIFVAAGAVAAALIVLAGLHATLAIEGIDRSLIAVASAYLTLLIVLAAGWLRRGRNGLAPADKKTGVDDTPGNVE